MILIFNKAGLLFLFFGVIGAWVAAFVIWALDLDERVPWALISFCVIPGSVDLGCRYFDLFKARASWRRLIRPAAGGQLFFIPVWILAVAVLVLTSIIG